MLVKHSLALLAQRAPGRSVEVRVPPFAAVQILEGTRHGRGTPPAVVETDARTWLALADGTLTWPAAMATGRLHASGRRSDLSPLLPVLDTLPTTKATSEHHDQSSRPRRPAAGPGRSRDPGPHPERLGRSRRDGRRGP